MKVTAPDGSTWIVRRRILPWRTYFSNVQAGVRHTTAEEWNNRGFVGMHGQQPGTGDIEPLRTAIRAVVLAIALPFILLFKFIAFRPWWVEVKLGDRMRHEEKAGHWSNSGIRMRELANQIETGDYRFEQPAA